MATALLQLSPGFTEQIWGGWAGPFITWALSRITGILPFSTIELLFAAWFTWRAITTGRGLAQARSGRRSWRHAWLAFALVLGQDLGVGLGVFYLAWGLNYARPDLEARLHWVDAELPEHLVTQLAEDAVLAANEAYRELHGVEDVGHPTSLGDPATLDVALEEGWQLATAELGLSGPVTWRHGPFKRLLISPALRRAGLSGFYSPFTGEANVNRSVPAVSLPQVAAHEKAHQRAIAPEDEANFFGWLAAARAPDPRARYSAHVFAQRQLLRALMRLDRPRAEALVGLRLPGVQRDVDDLYEYWALAQGTTGRISRAVNDAYLKTNRVEGGVLAYGGSVELMLRFAAGRREGLAAPPR